MRVLVCGGRDFRDKQKLSETLDAIVPRTAADRYGNWLPSDITILSGGAPGADRMAADWAVVNWCDLREFPANWRAHGPAAGPIRNQRMIDEGMPDLVVAFPGGRGTADMVSRARKAGIEVIEVPASGI